jgi:hypothetical protein
MPDAWHVGPPSETDHHADHVGNHLDLNIPMIDGQH